MDFRAFLRDNRVFLDGGMGTQLQEAGLSAGELPERWNITHGDVVEGIHTAYFNAGSNVVATNTFGANALKFSQDELEEIIKKGVEHAFRAKQNSCGKQEKFVALDIGPTGKLMQPYGDLAFEDAVEFFAKTVRLGVKYGVDLIVIETMGDAYETKAALLAAKENSSLPVLVTCAYDGSGKMMTGASPEVMSVLLESLGADGVGINCSLGPRQMQETVSRLLQASSLPVVVKPNAGLPVTKGDKVCYDIDEVQFTDGMIGFLQSGARVVGGCCGTTPAYIRALVRSAENIPLAPVRAKESTAVCSHIRTLELGRPFSLVACTDGDIDDIIDTALDAQDEGADLLSVSARADYIQELQAVVNLPLRLEAETPEQLEKALRAYNGKPLVLGDKEFVFPLVKKYGCAVAVKESMLEKARAYGIPNKNIFVYSA
ncbi:MAG: homocysteine S-methyltransferase family protein [Clostridia bacterium]|nr:homocysteine S-methyltransferase family protein [Clostridia bacterium]